MVGIFKFGMVYNNYLQLTNAVTDWARLFVEAARRVLGGDVAAQVIAFG